MPRDTITISRKEHKRLLEAEAKLKEIQEMEDVRSYKPTFVQKVKRALKEVETGKVRLIRGSKDLL